MMGQIPSRQFYSKNTAQGDSTCFKKSDRIWYQLTCQSRHTLHCLCLVVFSFPEEMEGDSEEPESRLSWLPAPLRKPLVTGYLTIHLLWPTQQPFIFECVFGPLSLCFSDFLLLVSHSARNSSLAFKCSWICCNYELGMFYNTSVS